MASMDVVEVDIVEVDDAGGSASVLQTEPNQATPVPAHPDGGPAKVGNV